MKIKRIYETPPHALIFQPTTIARFGAARLVRHFDGPYELIGGTEEERASAREWCSLFAPDVAFSSTPRRNPVSSPCAKSNCYPRVGIVVPKGCYPMAFVFV
jgi:hypothetical protein